MLSPYHRLSLHPQPPSSPHPPPHQNHTLYTTTFHLPDHHGIFSFRVNYKRPYLTYVDVKETVTLRHFAHDEWPRSWEISGAWPWVVGVWGVVAGWVGFVGVWLFCEDPKLKTKKGQ